MMVYTKYIKRGNKLYGPYAYQSKRVNGKVVTEYHGQINKLNYKALSFIILAVFILATFSYFIFIHKTAISGHAVLNINANYVSGAPLQGDLKITLKQGELLPASSRVIFENANSSYEFYLSDVVSDTSTTGDYYVQGTDITGSGLGYGLEGTKKIYPDVSFTLNVLTQQASENNTQEQINESSETSNPETNQTTAENTTNQEIAPQQENNTPNKQEQPPAPEQQSPQEQTPSTETTEQNPIPEQSSNQEQTSSQTTSETTPEAQTGITGSVISRLFKGISNFFLGLTPTGHASLEVQNQITGTTSATNPYSLNLQEGQTVELVSSEHDVNLNVNNNIATLTTTYSEDQAGFGVDYTGNQEKILTLNLSELNLIMPEGNMDVRIVYENTDIVSLSTVLTTGNLIQNQTTINATATNQTIINETIINETITNKSIVNVSNLMLTDEERQILTNKFGNAPVQITKAEKINGRIVVRYELGEYWAEFSYASESGIENLMEQDRIKWLKDLAYTLSSQETPSEEIEGFIGQNTSI